MGSTTLVSVEEYLKTEYVPRCEYVDGTLIEKAMPTWLHAAIQARIAALIMALFPKYIAASELTSRLRPTEFRLPDVAVELFSKVEGHDYPQEAVYLCVEILSPEDRLGKTFEKCERYHDWGVPFSWIVDPMKRRAWHYHKGGEPVEVPGTVEAGEIVLPLADIFSILNRPQEK